MPVLLNDFSSGIFQLVKFSIKPVTHKVSAISMNRMYPTGVGSEAPNIPATCHLFSFIANCDWWVINYTIVDAVRFEVSFTPVLIVFEQPRTTRNSNIQSH